MHRVELDTTALAIRARRGYVERVSRATLAGIRDEIAPSLVDHGGLGASAPSPSHTSFTPRIRVGRPTRHGSALSGGGSKRTFKPLAAQRQSKHLPV
jgi:hypothetical protein